MSFYVKKGQKHEKTCFAPHLLACNDFAKKGKNGHFWAYFLHIFQHRCVYILI